MRALAATESRSTRGFALQVVDEATAQALRWAGRCAAVMRKTAHGVQPLSLTIRVSGHGGRPRSNARWDVDPQGLVLRVERRLTRMFTLSSPHHAH
jgi:hypothetical protein